MKPENMKNNGIPDMAEVMKQMEEAAKNADNPMIKAMLEQQMQGMAQMMNNPMISGIMKQMQGGTAPDMSVIEKQMANQAGALSKKLDQYYQKWAGTPEERIASIPGAITGADGLAGYLSILHHAVSARIPADVRDGADKTAEMAAGKNPNNPQGGVVGAANGCWMFGHQWEALYLMGQVCLDDPTDADNLNNYAVFLMGCGQPEKAIPILDYLDKKYPGNSTVLNNAGHAWHALGASGKAEQYIDQAIKACGTHPQANYTKGLLEEVKGNTEAAAAFIKKSLAKTYSRKKEHKLKQLGGRPDPNPDWGGRMPQDPLGLEKIIIPDYPKSLGEMKTLKPLWEELQATCQKTIEDLALKANIIRERLNQKNMAIYEELVRKGGSTGSARIGYFNFSDTPPFRDKALAKLRAALDIEDGNTKNYRELNKYKAKYDKLHADSSALKNELYEKCEPIILAQTLQTGEGMPNEDEPFCSQLRALHDAYIGLINNPWADYGTDYLEYRRKECNNRAYYLQYATDGGDDAVELMKLEQKLEYIGAVYSAANSVFLVNPPCEEKIQKGKNGKLANFDDLHCKDQSTLSFPGLWSITISCNKIEAEISSGLPLAKAKWSEDLNTGEIISGSVMVGISTGLGAKELGPIKLEAKVGSGIFVEFDNSGVTDAGTYTEAKIEAGVNLPEGTDPFELKGEHSGKSISFGDLPSKEVGVQVRWGWNAGGSVAGTGLLE